MRALAWISAFIQSGQVKRDERGAAFTEYVVLLAVVVAMVVAVLLALSGPLNDAITRVGEAINGAGGTPTTP